MSSSSSGSLRLCRRCNKAHPGATEKAVLSAERFGGSEQQQQQLKEKQQQQQQHRHELTRVSFWNPHCFCVFSAIPDEVLLFNVFVYLDAVDLAHVAGVCTRWRFLALDKWLWRQIDFARLQNRLTRGYVDDAVVSSLVTRFGKHTERLRLCGCQHVSPQALGSVAAYCPRLIELHFCSVAAVNDDVLLALAGNASSSSCSSSSSDNNNNNNNNNLNNKDVGGVASLTKLSLHNCFNVSDAGVAAVLQQCTSGKLRELSLGGCNQLTDEVAHAMPPSLTALNLGSCGELSSRFVATLSSRCHRLRRLDLHNIEIADDGVEALVDNCADTIEILHLSSALPHISTLLTNTSLFALSRCRSLSYVSLQGSHDITDAGVVRFVRSPTVAATLQRLNLGRCRRLTDASVLAIGQSLRRLSHLSIFRVRVTSAGVAALSTLPELVHLDLHGCSRVYTLFNDHSKRGDNGDEQQRWAALRVLDASGCRGISHAHLVEFQRRFPAVLVK